MTANTVDVKMNHVVESHHAVVKYAIIRGMETKRRIPYGVINWAELVRECLFVDNTAYIRKLETVQTPVFLRPKRFGKSVVCSMLVH